MLAVHQDAPHRHMGQEQHRWYTGRCAPTQEPALPTQIPLKDTTRPGKGCTPSSPCDTGGRWGIQSLWTDVFSTGTGPTRIGSALCPGQLHHLCPRAGEASTNTKGTRPTRCTEDGEGMPDGCDSTGIGRVAYKPEKPLWELYNKDETCSRPEGRCGVYTACPAFLPPIPGRNQEPETIARARGMAQC